MPDLNHDQKSPKAYISKLITDNLILNFSSLNLSEKTQNLKIHNKIRGLIGNTLAIAPVINLEFPSHQNHAIPPKIPK
jgi:hypothetical protein